MHFIRTEWFRLGLAVVTIAALPAAAHAGNPAAPLGAPEGTVTLELDDLFTNKVELALPAYAKQNIVIYSLAGTLEDRLKNGCALTLPESGKVSIDKSSPAACRKLLLETTTELKLAASKVDSLGYTEIVRPALKAHGGKSDLLVGHQGDEKHKVWAWPAFAEGTVSLVTPPKSAAATCYVARPEGWIPASCEMKPPPPDEKKTAAAATLTVQFAEEAYRKIVEAGLDSSPTYTYTLAARVIDKDSPPGGAFRSFTLKATPPKAVNPADCEDKAPPSFDDECQSSAQKLLSTTPPPGPPASVQEALSAARETAPFYAVCIDYADKKSPRLSAYEITSGTLPSGAVNEKGSRPIANLRFDTRKAFRIYVRYPKDHKVVVEVGGSAAGWASETHARDGSGNTAGALRLPDDRAKPPCKPLVVTEFPQLPRLAGTMTIVTKLNEMAGDTPKEIDNRTWSLAIDNHIHFAVRLGLGTVWQPWSRRVEEVVAPGGAHYTAVTGGDGDPEGLYGFEIMAGLTWFPKEISETLIEPHFGIGAYLGLLHIKDNALDALTSLSIGPELAIGPDFSLGLLAGVHRNEVPKKGYEPGHVIPTGKNYASDGRQPLSFTPMFGLVLNFTPTMFKSIFQQ